MNSKLNPLGIAIFVSAWVAGCATTPQSITYVEAQPIKESESAEPLIVKVSTSLPLPGQLKSLPDSKEKVVDSKEKPWVVIEEANKSASHNPEQYGYFNAIMQYDYALGALYQVYAAPLKLTDIQLQPGEKIMGKPASGDTVRWVMGVGTSKVDGQVRQHVYVKPTKPGLHTTLSINTDKRTYHIELRSYKETYMAAVNWRYPHEEIELMQEQITKEKAESDLVTAPQVSLDQINSNYKVRVVQGKPKWTPIAVFDDGKKTFIEFPKEMLNREAPALFVLSSGNETQLVNYRVKNNYYIVDRLFERAELRVGQEDQDVVQLISGSYKSLSLFDDSGV